jgi:hypothetical protein
MTPRRLPSAAKPDSHRKNKILRSDLRNACATEEKRDQNKKRKRITPSPSPPPSVRVPDFNEFDRLVPSVTQSPLASSAATAGQSPPRRSPRLLKAPFKLSNFEVMSKRKVLVQGFKLDETTIHAWIRKDCEPHPVANASSLKIKAQNSFQSVIQRKQRLVKPIAGHSQRIADKSQQAKSKSTSKATKATKSKGLPPPLAVPPSIPSTSAIECNFLRRCLTDNFLCSEVGDALLPQIALDHPHHASYSALYKESGPKPLRII